MSSPEHHKKWKAYIEVLSDYNVHSNLQVRHLLNAGEKTSSPAGKIESVTHGMWSCKFC